MRVDDVILNCVCYMYGSEAGAASGAAYGGSGFILGMPVEGTRLLITYVVTARHVIEAGCTTARVNNLDGTPEATSIDPGEWFYPDDGSDVALARASILWSATTSRAVPASKLLTKEICSSRNIGIGDDVMMAGRLKYLDGKILNKPVARFGRIAMMPGEPIVNEDLDNEQLSFVAEMRSISGYSGSPVWIYQECEPRTEPILLGVDWGHLFERTKSGSRENASMTCVVPAWKILELLQRGDVVDARLKAVADGGLIAGLVGEDDAGTATDLQRPGPDPERLSVDGTLEDVARRVLDAGKPDDESSED